VSTYILRRALQLIPVLVLVSIFAFALIFVLPGDPALAILGEELARDQVLYQQMRADLGLNRPLAIQYLDWAGRVMRGDLGTSTRAKIPVTTLLLQRAAPTLQLGIMGLLLSVLVAIPVGIVSAIKPNSKSDVAVTILSMVTACIPHFWLGLLLIMAFSLGLGWLPPSGYVPPTENLLANLRLMIMPTITIAGGAAAVLMRQTRSAMLEVLRQEYVVTARSKGLVERVVVLRHALKNALLPVVTVIGLQVGTLMGGAVITESIFSIPGVGRLAADSIFTRDFPVVQAVVLLMATAVLLANLLTDIAYAWLDPRIHYR
jgi:peptide/nickel transport system permease protein